MKAVIYARYSSGSQQEESIEGIHQAYPARSCVEVARLPKDVQLACEVIAEI